MQSLSAKSRCFVSLVVLATGALGCSVGADGEEPISDVAGAIVGGTAPAKGALQSWGVVHLFDVGCTGVMLTNRHVLTAQHCIRDIETAPFSSKLPTRVRLEKAPPELDEDQTASNAFEHPQPYSFEFRDFAILVLDNPLKVDGAPNKFYRRVWGQPDFELKSKSVFCAGYGITTLGTRVGNVWTPAGNSKLTSADQLIDDVLGNETNGTLIRKIHNGIVGAGGDSGSPCFAYDGTNWTITGPQSNCPDFDFDDVNNDQQFQWNEATAVRECRGAAPSAYRYMVADNLFANVTLSYDALPTVPAGTQAIGTITTTEKSFTMSAFSGNSFLAPRSGSIQAVVSSEPANMMCPPVVPQDAPMTGSLAMTGRCLADGLVASMTSNML